MHPLLERHFNLTRRELFKGVGLAALATLLDREADAAEPGLHFAPKAKRVVYLMHGGASLGAWLSYGLGSMNQTLRAYVVMTSRDKEASCGQLFYEHYWGSGFLPSRFQGVQFRPGSDPVLYLSNPPGVSAEVRRGLLEDLSKLNELKLKETGDPEISSRIAQYEM